MTIDQLFILPILLFSVVVHEVSHGWMALRLGDPTAKEMGRLTLNPLPHIDPVGSVLVPILSLMAGGAFLAWAKPVPINPQNFSHPRRDDILVSAIGPLSNIVLAFCCTMIVIVLRQALRATGPEASFEHTALAFLADMFAGGISLNIILAVFNLIPVPPLDGSHVLASLLPPAWSIHYRKIGFMGIFVLLFMMRWKPFADLFWSVVAALIFPFTKLMTLV